MADRRGGIELPHIYDGVSVWVEADGTLTNRWAEYARDGATLHPVYQRRSDLTQQWIDANKEGFSA